MICERKIVMNKKMLKKFKPKTRREAVLKFVLEAEREFYKKCRKYRDVSWDLTTWTTETLEMISEKIAHQVKVINLNDGFHDVTPVKTFMKHCIDGDHLTFRNIYKSPFYLEYRIYDENGKYTPVWTSIDPYGGDREELIEALWRFVPYGLDMDGIEPKDPKIKESIYEPVLDTIDEEDDEDDEYGGDKAYYEDEED